MGGQQLTAEQLAALTVEERALYDLWVKSTAGPWNADLAGATYVLRGPGGGTSLLENKRDREYAVAAVNAVSVLLDALADERIMARRLLAAERAELAWYRQAGAAWLAVGEHYAECANCEGASLCEEAVRLNTLIDGPILAALEARGEE